MYLCAEPCGGETVECSSVVKILFWLKTLHLSSVTFSKDKELAKLLYGSPNLEELEVIWFVF